MLPKQQFVTREAIQLARACRNFQAFRRKLDVLPSLIWAGIAHGSAWFLTNVGECHGFHYVLLGLRCLIILSSNVAWRRSSQRTMIKKEIGCKSFWVCGDLKTDDVVLHTSSRSSCTTRNHSSLTHLQSSLSLKSPTLPLVPKGKSIKRSGIVSNRL